MKRTKVPTAPPRRWLLRGSGIASAAAVCIGSVATIALLREAGMRAIGQVVWSQRAVAILGILLLSTAANLGIRFLRWQYLLRASGVVVPTRPSLRIYLSAFALLLTPLYLGEILYKVFFCAVDSVSTSAAAVRLPSPSACTMPLR